MQPIPRSKKIVNDPGMGIDRPGLPINRPSLPKKGKGIDRPGLPGKGKIKLPVVPGRPRKGKVVKPTPMPRVIPDKPGLKKPIISQGGIGNKEVNPIYRNQGF
jgi:hypothetical protein